MKRAVILETLERSGIIAVIRLRSADKLTEIIDALISGGIQALEITMTTPNAVEIIRDTSQNLSADFIIGAGTVLDSDTAVAVIRAGAQFVVSPVFKPEIISVVHQYDKVAIPGAFSATEILAAWESGADMVKVFPATVLGLRYFKDIHGPLPQVKLTPTGGVSLSNAEEFIRCGAVCLGVGSALLDKELIRKQDWTALTQRARQFKAAVARGRTEK
ncbi:MAG TPA: bifunctional 4-hydroxy-2-oxoglutarate aldolase/2-dehydro-3-deoxy-phosphogluconate aldolase [Candidatus Marinimicrobia bacterium]|nr:bifunctional 4-hydroxy-2-oxoglutarate aldolase/2-dehydro-3-deoxy-phosphogluconate aldolase [Candidatus Neomarinimicrobiota bacterium]